MSDFLVTQLAERLGTDPDTAKAALTALLDDMHGELALGHAVTMPGVGTFRQDITGVTFTPDVNLIDAVNMTYSGLGNLSLDAAGGPIAELPPTSGTPSGGLDFMDPTAFELPPSDEAEHLALNPAERATELPERERLPELPPPKLAALPPAQMHEPEPPPSELGDLSFDDVQTLDDLVLPDPFAALPAEETPSSAPQEVPDEEFDPYAETTLFVDSPPQASQETGLPGTDAILHPELSNAAQDEAEEIAGTPYIDETDPSGYDETVLMPAFSQTDTPSQPEEPADGLSFLAPEPEESPNLSFLPPLDEPEENAEGNMDTTWLEPASSSDDALHPLGPAPKQEMEEADFSVMPPLDPTALEEPKPFDFIEGFSEQEEPGVALPDVSFSLPSLEAEEGLAPAPRDEPDTDIPLPPTMVIPEIDQGSKSSKEQDRRPLFLIGALGMVLVVVLAMLAYQFLIKDQPDTPAIAEDPTSQTETPPTDPSTSASQGNPENGAAEEGTLDNTITQSGNGSFSLPFMGGIDFAQGGWTVIIGSETLYSRAAAKAAGFQQLGQSITILQGRSDGLTRYRIALGQFQGASAADRFRRQNANQLPDGAWVLRIRPSMRYNP